MVPFDIFNMVTYVTLTSLTKSGNILLFSFHLRAPIFFIDKV